MTRRLPRLAPSGSAARWNFALSWRAATLIFGGVGALMLICSGREAYRRAEQLRTWPSIRATVDSAAIVTPQDRREAVYAARYWVSYPRAGRAIKTVATEPVYTSNYGAVARRLESTRRSGTLQALESTVDPRQLALNAGWNTGFFFTALVMGGLGLGFSGFAAVFWWFGRCQGMGAPAAGWVPLPARYGVWFGAVMGSLFLSAVALLAYTSAQHRRDWSRIEARVDSADVVRESDKSGYLYAPRLWLSYSVRDSLYHYPLVQSWSSSNYRGQARRAAEAARLGRMGVRVNPWRPYDVVNERPGSSSAFLYAIFGFFTVFSFGMAYVFHRIGPKKRRRAA